MITPNGIVNTVAMQFSKVTLAGLMETDVDSQAAAAKMHGLKLLSLDIVTPGVRCLEISSGYGAVVITGEWQ